MPTENTNGESNLWARIIQPDNNGLPAAAARALLELRFSEQDKARMSELAEKNKEGHLTEEERGELENYVRVGDVLSLIHLKARKSLKG
jgi:hypothetical protein